MDNQPSAPSVIEAGDVNDVSGSGKAAESESEAIVHALQDRVKWPEQHVKKVGLLYLNLILPESLKSHLARQHTTLLPSLHFVRFYFYLAIHNFYAVSMNFMSS